METQEAGLNSRTPLDRLERACADTDCVELELLEVVERLHQPRKRGSAR